MTLFILSLLAGVLTVLAPCTISLLPVIVGGSVSGERSIRRALVVTASLGASVILFTFVLKVSTAFIAIPQSFWHWLSGAVIVLLGLAYIFPTLYERLPLLNRLNRSSNRLIATGYQKHNFTGDILVGAALGPVFSSCSPTYFLILAAVLPSNFVLGTVYLVAYAIGLCGMLLLVAIAGQKLLHALGVASDPRGWFKQSIGVLFVLVGVVIFFGYDQQLELMVSEHIFDVTQIEQKLLPEAMPSTPTEPATNTDSMMHDDMMATTTVDMDGAMMASSTATSTNNEMMMLPAPATKPSVVSEAARKAKEAALYQKEPEITKPSGFINTDGQPITLKQFVGKKVVLVDFWTYSCINCQRTLPYLKAWYDKYHDQGLEIVSIHTPEFAFEHVLSNVQSAVDQFGIKYPVVLDNDYGTWNAFKNQYWPREYLINIDGYIVHDHTGEGGYDESEKAIQAALKERAEVLGLTDGASGSLAASQVPTVTIQTQSPETYFGSNRNQYLANGQRGVSGEQQLVLPPIFALNQLYLGGTWNFVPEYASATSGATVVYHYRAKHVYLVAESPDGGTLKVEQDSQTVSGGDVSSDGSLKLGESRLYDVVNNDVMGEHTLKFTVTGGTVHLYTFTFG